MAKFSIEVAGAEITKLREAKGLSQERLAEILGNSRATVNAWEGRGSVRLTQEIADRLAAAVGVKTSELSRNDKSSKDMSKSGGVGYVPEHVLEHYRNTAEHIMQENRRLWERLDRLEAKGGKTKQAQ